jgi:hypothetical protein
MKNIFLGIVLWTVLVLAIIIGWLLVPATFWRYLFFLRVPILMGLLLLGLPAIAKFILPAMLKNLFVLRGIQQLAFTILGATIAGVAVIFVTVIILDNAPARFGVPPLPAISPLWRYGLAIALALPTTLVATDLSREEIDKERWKGLFVGILFSAIFLFAFKRIRTWLAGQDGFNGLFINIISFLAKHSTQGYIDPKTGTLTTWSYQCLRFFLSPLSRLPVYFYLL